KRDSAMPTTPPRSMARATWGMPQVPFVTPKTFIPAASHRVTTARELRSMRPRSIDISGPDIGLSVAPPRLVVRRILPRQKPLPGERVRDDPIEIVSQGRPGQFTARQIR